MREYVRFKRRELGHCRREPGYGVQGSGVGPLWAKPRYEVQEESGCVGGKHGYEIKRGGWGHCGRSLGTRFKRNQAVWAGSMGTRFKEAG